MPAMASPERAFCRSRLWRRAAGHSVLHWALQDVQLSGSVLEVGCGAGDASLGLLETFPGIDLTAVDIDPCMVRVASQRIGARARVVAGDVSALKHGDASFDAVLSLLMLHHVIEWERALAEIARVLRPGGQVIGYDLLDTRAARLLHRLDRSPFRLVTASEFDAVAVRLRLVPCARTVLGAGHLLRFRLRRA